MLSAITELERRLADVVADGSLDTPIQLNLNGCPNSCARIQTADIGLKGQIVTVDGPDGPVQQPGFQVHLGGDIGLNAGFGRKLRAHKVTSEGLDDYVTVVVGNYLADRSAGESFGAWVARADEELLRGEKSLDAVPV